MSRFKPHAWPSDGPGGLLPPENTPKPIGYRFIWHVEGGGEPTESTIEAHCPNCGAAAIVALPKVLMDQQPDGTTHVCHPTFGGCNHGFVQRLEGT